MARNRKSWVTQQLRRLSMKWAPRNKVKNSGRREYYKTKKDGSRYSKPNFEYECNHCKNWFPDSKVVMDHIIPVIDVKQESVSEQEFYGLFITGLFSYEDNWQVLCGPCHDEKTREENEIRKQTKNS